MWNCDWGGSSKAAGRTYGGRGDARRRRKKEKKRRCQEEEADRAANRRKRARETPRATAAAAACPTTNRRPLASTQPAAAKKKRVAVAPRPVSPHPTPAPTVRAAMAAANDDSAWHQKEKGVAWGLDIVDAEDEVRAPQRAPTHQAPRRAAEEIKIRSQTHRGKGRESSAIVNLRAAAKRTKSSERPPLRAAERSFDEGAHSPSSAEGVPARRRQQPLSSNRGGQWQRDEKTPSASPAGAHSKRKRTGGLFASGRERGGHTPFSRSIGQTGSALRREGFRNLGNTCYMNAVLRALLSINSLRTDLAAFVVDDDATAAASGASNSASSGAGASTSSATDAAAGAQGGATTALQCVARVARALVPGVAARKHPIDLSRFKTCVGRHNARFAGNRQQGELILCTVTVHVVRTLLTI